MSASSEAWGVVELDAGDESTRTFGDLTLRIRRTPQEVWIHGSHGVEAAPDPGEWMRWAIEPDDHVALRPKLPDRPVVVSPEQPFHMPPHGSARVFVRIPLFASVARVAADGDESVLCQHPALVLSDTWWGSLTEGEIAYWLTTKARRAVSPEIFGLHLAVCPLELSNESAEPLAVERFAVRGAHLTLFGRKTALWTDEVRVRYEGSADGTQIRYTGRVPEIAGEVEKVSPPREPPPRGLTALTFGRLRAISGWA